MDVADEVQETDSNSLAAMYFLAGLCLVAGILPGIFIDALAPVSNALVGVSMPYQAGLQWPRPGAKRQSEEIARSKVPPAVAVSCNPASFARDARILVDGGYRMESVTPLDQFLWSPHVEVIAVFRK